MDKGQYLFIKTKEDIDAWHHFISGISGTHYEQTAAWAKIRENDGWSSERVVIKNSSGITAGAQIMVRNISFIGNIGYISHGPCVKDHSEKYTVEIIEAIKQLIKHEKIRYMVINLPYFSDYMVSMIKSRGFQNTIKGLPPAELMDSTLLIDLSKDIDQIHGELKKKTRYCIRTGIKKGVTIREGNRNDIRLFFDLMIETCRRRNSPPTHPDIRFFYNLWDNFYEYGWVKLHIAQFNDEPICAGLSIAFADIFKIWKFGWSGKYKDLFASHVLDWHLISLAKKEGYRYFDFVMLDTELAKHIINNLPITDKLKSRNFYGASMYKLGYGGKIVLLPGSLAYVPNPAIRVMLYCMGFILKQKWARKIIDKFWKKIINR